MPIKDRAEQRKGLIRHSWTTFIFDLIEQANNVAASDGVDLHCAEGWVDQALECFPAFLTSTELDTFPGMIFLTDCFEGLHRRDDAWVLPGLNQALSFSRQCASLRKASGGVSAK